MDEQVFDQFNESEPAQEITEPVTEIFEPAQILHKKKKNFHWITAILAAVCLVLATVTATVLFMPRDNAGFDESLLNELQDQIDALENQLAAQRPNVELPLPEDAMSPGQVYAKNVSAVVAISNESLRTNIYGQVSKTASSGSGFVVSSDGYVVTNYHVVEGATTLRVITAAEKEYDAKLVGYDSANDIAVLKIEEQNLPFVKIGSSNALQVGEMVLAIGNPLGELTSTLTVGYISAKDRMVNTDGTNINMLQTDAAINSGNSGGPLFNLYGEVVGITTAKYSGTSNSGATIEGIGFAIPMDDVAKMVEDLMTRGYVTGAYLGVMVKDMDPTVCDTYGLPKGVYVDEVTEGYCAEKAGVLAKDIILKLGSQKVESMSSLTKALREFEPGTSTTITVYRAGTEKVLDITLDEKPAQTPTQPEEPAETTPSNDDITDWFNGMFPGFGG